VFILLCPMVGKRTHSGGGSIRRGQVRWTSTAHIEIPNLLIRSQML
jgi:hypothetical protein